MGLTPEEIIQQEVEKLAATLKEELDVQQVLFQVAYNTEEGLQMTNGATEAAPVIVNETMLLEAMRTRTER